MNLTDMAAFICGKVNLSEAEDLAACKGFLTRRHDMLWLAELWKDSLIEYRQTLNPTGYTVTSNWLPVKSVLLCPTLIDRVLAIRTDSRKLNVRRPEWYYRVDFDAFAKTAGVVCDFVGFPRCVWEFDATAGAPGLPWTAAPQNIYAIPANAGDNGSSVTSDLLDADGTGVTRYTTPLLGATLAGNSDRVDAFQKPVSQGSIALGAAADGSLNFLTLAASDQSAKRRERVRLVEVPSAPLTLRLLGKRITPSFTADLDEPGIRGSENCLIAFGQADMLQRARQYGKSGQLMQQEGLPLLAQLKELEVVQQAHNLQITPETGYDDEYVTRLTGFSF